VWTVYGLATDTSPTASPKVITPAFDTGIPQYPTTYNGDMAAHVEVSPVVTDSSPPPYVEPALPESYSESDNTTTKEPVCSVLQLCICN